MSLREQQRVVVGELERMLDGFVYAQFALRVADRVECEASGVEAERVVDELELFVTDDDRWIHCYALRPDFDGGWHREWRGIVEGHRPAFAETLSRHARRWLAAVESGSSRPTR